MAREEAEAEAKAEAEAEAEEAKGKNQKSLVKKATTVSATLAPKTRRRRGKGLTSLYPPPDGQVFQFSAPLKEDTGYPSLPPHDEGDYIFPFKFSYDQIEEKNLADKDCEIDYAAENGSAQVKLVSPREMGINLLDEIKKIDVLDDPAEDGKISNKRE